MRTRQADANGTVVVDAIVIGFTGTHGQPPLSKTELQKVGEHYHIHLCFNSLAHNWAKYSVCSYILQRDRLLQVNLKSRSFVPFPGLDPEPPQMSGTESGGSGLLLISCQ